MSAVCKEGHLSDEPDYCSVCGAPILAGSTPATPLPTASTSGPGRVAGSATCPSCGEQREDPDARFCEVCRYDFLEKRPGPPPVARTQTPAPASVVAAHAMPSAPSAPSAPSPSSPSSLASALPIAAPAKPLDPPAGPSIFTPATGWELVITVDPSLDTEPDPETPCPTNRPELVILVDKPDMLVGRHDDTRAIHPEVSLHDPGASRRHARFVLEPDGAIALQDLASTNGTEVNGKAVPPGTRRRLADGDRVTLGRWTRITLRNRA
jgi:hypothetical protein